MSLLFGHRGCSHAPENTLAAFRHALADGAHGVECDVRTTLDGILVLVHDETIRGHRVDHLARAKMEAATLAEALDLCRRRDARINVEVKKARPHAVVAAIRRAGMIDRTILSSFDHEIVRAAKALEPGLTGSALVESSDLPHGIDIIAAADAIVTAAYVAAAGRPVHVWTVNSPTRAKELLSWGVEGIISDVPDRLRSLFS
jgi:glycerophosphoryl diester phosphodiesterase